MADDSPSTGMVNTGGGNGNGQVYTYSNTAVKKGAN